MAEESTEIARLEKAPIDLNVLRIQAEALKDFVEKQGLSKNFGGPKNHLYFEANQFLGSLSGYTATIKSTEVIRKPNGEFFGVEATASLYQDGQHILDVKNACCRDENTWKNKPYYQLLSMAETRAMSKAYRSKLAYVVSLAGYAPTPAEEMPTNGTTAPDPQPEEPQDAPKTQLDGKQVSGEGDKPGKKEEPKKEDKGSMVDRITKGQITIREKLTKDFTDVPYGVFEEWVFNNWEITDFEGIAIEPLLKIYVDLQGGDGCSLHGFWNNHTDNPANFTNDDPRR